MARRRYRKFYRRKSTRYSANILDIANQNITAVPGDFFGYINLTTNPVQSAVTVSQTYTVKRFSLDMTIDTQYTNYIEAVTAYIMYLPQGMEVTESYHINHPEYILAYKYLGNPQQQSDTSSNQEAQNFQPTRIRSRLARKLQSGDSVILYLKGYNQNTSNTYNLGVQGLVRWWTKAN